MTSAKDRQNRARRHRARAAEQWSPVLTLLESAQWIQTAALDATMMAECRAHGEKIGRMSAIRARFAKAPEALRAELRALLLDMETPLSLADIDRCAGILARGAVDTLEAPS